MLEIKKLQEEDIESFTKLFSNAYPGFPGTPEQKKANMTRFFGFPEREFYGAFKGDTLVGGVCLLDFEMNLRGDGMIPVGGIALVAVDLLRKKEKIAKEILTYSLDHFRQKGISYVTLYPFRMSFYKQMGFGYGAEYRRFNLETSGINNFGSKDNLEMLTEANLEEVLACYNRYSKTRNGLTPLAKHHLEPFFRQDAVRVVGYRQAGELKGYMVMRFQREQPLVNQLVISHLVYETNEAIQEFCTFLHTQEDQFHRVSFSTQDENILFLLNNPSTKTYDAFEGLYLETSVTGCGLMVRAVDVAGLFGDLKHHNFNGESVKLSVTLADSFLPENNRSTLIQFIEGRPEVIEGGAADVELTIRVDNFSSLIAGATSFRSLHMTGLAKLSDDSYAAQLQRLFRTEEKPMCMFGF